MRTRNAPRSPSRIPGAASITSTGSQGGDKRKSAPGSACQRNTTSAGAAIRVVETNSSLIVGEGLQTLPPFVPHPAMLPPLTNPAAHQHPHPATIEQCHIKLSHNHSESLREPEGRIST